MDRLSELAADLTRVLTDLREEADARDLRELAAPLAWLDEANCWLRYELERVRNPAQREPVPFTYIPVALRR